MGLLGNIGRGLSKVAGKQVFWAKKHSPELLIVGGVVAFAGTIFFACKATLHADELLKEHNENMENIEEARQRFDEEEYSNEAYKKDKLTQNTQTIIKVVKAYVPAAVGAGVTLFCFIGSFKIMKGRQAALAAAYAVLDEAFREYRQGVRDRYGEQADFDIRHGVTNMTVTDPTTGEVTTQKTFLRSGEEMSGYGRIFGPQRRYPDGSWSGSSCFTNSHKHNAAHLSHMQRALNQRLAVEGIMTLNQVYETLGFTKTLEGQLVGWRYKNGGPYSEGVIRFCDDLSFFDYEDGQDIPLDFNVDGYILDDFKRTMPTTRTYKGDHGPVSVTNF